MDYARKKLIILSLAGCALIPAQATVIHKWVDADGVTHYSDEAPATTETPVTLIDVPANGADPEAVADDYYSITNQWERMNRERIEREKLNLEKARLEAARQSSAPQVVYVNEPAETRYVIAYPRLLHRKHGWHRLHRKFGQHHGGLHKSHDRQRQVSLGSFPHVD